MDNELLTAIEVLMDRKLQPIQNDLTNIKEDVSGLKEDVSGLKEDVSSLKEDVFGLKEDVFSLKQDVTNLQKDMRHVKDRLTRTEIIMENDVATKINFLYEGFSGLKEKVSESNDNKKELDETKDRVHTLETVATAHAKDIQDIKKKIG